MKEPNLYKILRPIISFFVKGVLKPKIINKQYIPKNEKIILAGTHTSNLDCLLIIASTKRCVHFLAKKELFKGIKKIVFSNMGLIKVNRKIKDKSVIPSSIKYLKENKVIAIFPEGTIEKGNKLLPFKLGTVKIAHDSNCKIVPFVIKGKYFSKNLKIVYGPPFSIKTNDLDLENKKFFELINKMVKEN